MGRPHHHRVAPPRRYTLGSGLKEVAASGLGIDERAVARDLGNFKDMIEGRR